jgi:hypothetical protein
MTDNKLPPNLQGLATLLVLQDQVKNLTNLKEFGYFTTNETHRLLHFNTAYLWQKWELFDIQLLAQSEVAEIDQQTPANQWVKEAIKSILKIPNSRVIQAFDFGKSNPNPDTKVELNQDVVKTWPDVLPRHVLWSPFLDLSDEISGGLLLFRENPFTEQEVKMFRWLANNYQYTWQFLTKNNLIYFHRLFKKRVSLTILSVIAVGILLFPLRLSVVASATVSPKSPAFINAPIPGVIKEFLVKPGERVKSGQLLLELDKRDLQNSVAVTQKKFLYTQAKLRSATSQGYNKTDVRSEVPILQAELAVNKAELEYTQSILNKTDIYSPIDGVAVFDSKEDWLGQPVQAGENILTIADPNQVELKIALPTSELINLEVGTLGKFYVYGQLSEVPVSITTLGYNAKMMPNKTLAYQFIAEFTDPASAPRLGSQGTVRLYGHYVPLFYYLLRRPMQAIRQIFGV